MAVSLGQLDSYKIHLPTLRSHFDIFSVDRMFDDGMTDCPFANFPLECSSDLHTKGHLSPPKKPVIGSIRTRSGAARSLSACVR